MDQNLQEQFPQEIESLRGDKAGIEAQRSEIVTWDVQVSFQRAEFLLCSECQEHYQGQLQELKKTMVGDVQRLQDIWSGEAYTGIQFVLRWQTMIEGCVKECQN